MEEAQAFWVVGEQQGEIRSLRLPARTRGQVLVRARYGAISRGTELLVWRGQVPESEHVRMRAPHQKGEFPWPVSYGYSNVGRVEQGPDELVGCNVFCLHPHQSAYIVSASDVLTIPDDVPPQRAVLAANLETALNAVWDAELRAGDRVRVVGAGTVGALVAYLAARHPGTEVELVDVDDSRAALAQTLGVRFALPADAEPEADLVFEASGAPQGLEAALSLAGQEATVLALSWFGRERVSLPLGEAFHARRLSIRSSQVGSLPARQRARWSTRRRLALALSLLVDERLDALFTDDRPFEQLPEIMADLSAPRDRTLCQRIVYGES